MKETSVAQMAEGMVQSQWTEQLREIALTGQRVWYVYNQYMGNARLGKNTLLFTSIPDQYSEIPNSFCFPPANSLTSLCNWNHHIDTEGNQSYWYWIQLS